MHAIVALNEWVTQVVDAEFVQTLKGTKVKVQVVWVPAANKDALSACLRQLGMLAAASGRGSKH